MIMKKNRNKKDSKPLLKKIIENEKEQLKNNKGSGYELDKSTVNKRMIYAMVFFIFLFLFVVLYLVYFQLFKSESIADNNHNKRHRVDENAIERGNIFDREGRLLVYSDKDENGYNYRVYNFGEVDAVFTGYNSVTYGKTGIEKTYNSELLNIPKSPVGQFRGMVEKSGVGNDLNLSINQDIQNITYSYLEGKVGAIVVMKPRTGEVLAMASNPTFDPNSLDYDWDNLIQDTDAPLLNRVTQGVYRPGSTMKIVTTSAILESGIDENYNDTGTETIQGYDIKNYGDYEYGPLDLRQAFIYSVNTYFAAKADQMGKDSLMAATDKYMFNKKYDFDLETVGAKIPYDELNQADLAMTAFGYGKTQVTPLHMAMIVSSIANDGKMMKPRLVNSVVDEEGKVIEKEDPEVLSEVTDYSTAQTIRDYMVEVVNEGTAKGAFLEGIQVAGKTGTTDKENGSTDARFVGFAPAYDPQIAVSIVLEDDGSTGGESAAPIAGALINDIISNVSLD